MQGCLGSIVLLLSAALMLLGVVSPVTEESGVVQPTQTAEQIVPNPDRAFVVGHRGAAGLAPENTLAALEEALRAGATAVEFDVQTAACGTPVLFHDEMLGRTTNGVGPTRLIKTPEADLVIYASYLHSSEGGTLPYMLAKALKLTDS